MADRPYVDPSRFANLDLGDQPKPEEPTKPSTSRDMDLAPPAPVPTEAPPKPPETPKPPEPVQPEKRERKKPEPLQMVQGSPGRFRDSRTGRSYSPQETVYYPPIVRSIVRGDDDDGVVGGEYERDDDDDDGDNEDVIEPPIEYEEVPDLDAVVARLRELYPHELQFFLECLRALECNLELAYLLYRYAEDRRPSKASNANEWLAATREAADEWHAFRDDNRPR